MDLMAKLHHGHRQYSGLVSNSGRDFTHPFCSSAQNGEPVLMKLVLHVHPYHRDRKGGGTLSYQVFCDPVHISLEESRPVSNLRSGQGHAIAACAQEREPASSAKACKHQMKSLRFDLFFSPQILEERKQFHWILGVSMSPEVLSGSVFVLKEDLRGTLNLLFHGGNP